MMCMSWWAFVIWLVSVVWFFVVVVLVPVPVGLLPVVVLPFIFLLPLVMLWRWCSGSIFLWRGMLPWLDEVHWK